MGLFSNVNCQKCGDGPKGKKDTKEALAWSAKHGGNKHGNRFVGLKWSNVSDKRK